jgi:hypothetical protein
MAIDVSPQRLARAERRCMAIQSLHMVGGMTSSKTCQLIMRCTKTKAIDGFLYNTCLLAITRSLRQKQSFMMLLKTELSHQRRLGGGSVESSQDLCKFIAERIACHVTVMIHASHIVQPADF